MIWVEPDGKELFRRSGWRRPEEFLSDLRRASAMVPGPRRSKAEALALLKALEEGQAALAAGKFAEAASKLEEAAKPDVEVIRGEAKAALDSIRTRGDEMLAGAQASLKAGSVRRARPLLELLAREFPAFDCGREAAKLLQANPR